MGLTSDLPRASTKTRKGAEANGCGGAAQHAVVGACHAPEASTSVVAPTAFVPCSINYELPVYLVRLDR